MKPNIDSIESPKKAKIDPNLKNKRKIEQEKDSKESNKKVKFDIGLNETHPIETNTTCESNPEKGEELEINEDQIFKEMSKQILKSVSGEEKQTITFDGDVQIEPFNLIEERQKGHFDGDGNYIERTFNKLNADPWLEECDKISEGDSKYSAERWATNLETYRLEQESDQKKKGLTALEQYQMIEKLLAFLGPNETVLSALKRYSKDLPNKNSKKQNDATSTFSQLTEIADDLMAVGYSNVYIDTPETIRNKFSSRPKAAPTHFLWKYKIAATVYGPFSSETMKEWNSQGYFSNSSPEIFVQKINPSKPDQHNEFVPIQTVKFE